MFDPHHAHLFRSLTRKAKIFFLAAIITLSTTGHLFAQDTSKKPASAKPSAAEPVKATKAAAAKPAPGPRQDSSRETTGIPWIGLLGVQESTSQIMDRDRQQGPGFEPPEESEAEKIRPSRRNLEQNPDSPNVSQFPPKDPSAPDPQPLNPQTLGTSFTGTTLSEAGFFPPDSMGAVGPTQFLVGVNGRIKTFNKSTGLTDGVINTSMNVFFNSVRGGVGTSDPRVRYDRQSGRWFVLMITVSTPNRVMLAVSDSGIITGGTVWTFFFFQQDQPAPAGDTGCLADYPSLGIDGNALYVGVNQFCGAPLTYNGTTAFVIRKSSVLGAGPIVVSAFRNLTGTPIGPGLYTPQGVDNFDPGATTGYFIGVNNDISAGFGTLVLRRVSNPGGTPTLSLNTFITVPTTSFPITVRHQGNNNGTTGQLDALDDRLYQAVIRNGRLWTAHNIGVDNTGVANGGTRTRDGSRWYELSNLDTATPTLVQSGTLFTPSATNTFNDRNYWIPSVMVSGQGHMALGCSTAGTNEFANGATAGRLASDPLGILQADLPLTASTTAYNPPGDPGGGIGRRWGDYSYTSLDPCDDMTMWTIQEFCSSANNYGVRVVKLMAPPPVTPTTADPPNVDGGQASVNVVITGNQVAGSGFYDPGAGFDCRLSATVSGGVAVNSVTFNSPTSVTLNISTVAASQGPKNVTITNPDGQSVTANNLINVGEGACTFSINPTNQNFPSAGGTSSVNVMTQTGCAWTAVSNAPWITITSGASGSGNGTVNYSVAANLVTTPRTGTMTIAGETFTVNQDAAPNVCVTSISPATRALTTFGGQGSVTVQAQPNGCTWTAVSDSSWLIILSGSTGTGNGKVNYAAGINAGTCRVGRITIGDFVHTVSQTGFQGGTCCVYTISPTNQSFTSTGGSNSVAVNVTTGCAWTAVSNAPWINITSGASGNGNGTVNYSVAANPNASPRTGTMTIAGETFTVNQAAAPCVFNINPTSQNFTSTGGSNSVGVTAPNGCNWTAVSNAPWITITSGASGNGNGTVNYSVDPNASPNPRTGTMTIAGQTFTVNQEAEVGGCTFTIDPTSQNFPFAGGSNSVDVMTQTGCNWTAVSNDPWITITSGSSGSGNGTVNYSVAANPDITPRMGTMTIAGQTFTVNQAAAPCVFNINPTSQNFTSTGGSNSVNVTAQTGCAWTAVSNAPWITITSGASGTGNGTVNYSVAANLVTTPRTGTMTIAGQTFTVNQDAAPSSCTFSINPTSKTFPKFGGITNVSVTATPGCSWTTVSNAPWINILSGSSGTGNGSVTIAVGLNPGAPRTGTATIAGQTFTVTQQ